MADRITTQSRPLNILINALHELHLRKQFDMADTRSNIQLDNLNSNPRGEKVSETPLIVKLYPTSILPQGQNTIILSSWISFMDPIT